MNIEELEKMCLHSMMSESNNNFIGIEAMDDKEIEREGEEIEAYYFENEKLCKYEVEDKPIGYALEDGEKDGLVKIQFCPSEFEK